jgi:hypothetical protein
MICRIWRGWTTVDNASRYEAVVRGEVIPAIEARHIPGFLSIDLMRREVPEDFEPAGATPSGWVKWLLSPQSGRNSHRLARLSMGPGAGS